jgi:putative endonuclease
MRPKDALGRYGEDLAEGYLRSQGFTILERNWRCPTGEIDIVAREGATLVVCEVKTRRSTAFGSPLEAVGPRKLRRLRELGLHWLDENGVHAPRIRIDVIGILRPLTGAAVIDHLRGV